jgi:hypothetical protein
VVEDDRGVEEVGEHRSVVVVNDRERRVVCTDRIARREIGRIMVWYQQELQLDIDLDAIDSCRDNSDMR